MLGFACPAALPKREPMRERQLLDALGFASDREYFEAVMGHMKALSALTGILQDVGRLPPCAGGDVE